MGGGRKREGKQIACLEGEIALLRTVYRTLISLGLYWEGICLFTLLVKLNPIISTDH